LLYHAFLRQAGQLHPQRNIRGMLKHQPGCFGMVAQWYAADEQGAAFRSKYGHDSDILSR
jgi:hypothetical protein